MEPTAAIGRIGPRVAPTDLLRPTFKADIPRLVWLLVPSHVTVAAACSGIPVRSARQRTRGLSP